PVKDLLNSLRSINYENYISLEWDPEWVSELADANIILPQFTAYLSSYDDTPWKKNNLYSNRAGTGSFIWKKEVLIEKTFSEVLDAAVKNFPDQLAFKYTTLDYTRTYTEFRDDVDEFARVLVSLGVKPGSHVAIWASNVPQWYITFWATVKLGAVLVTVNTNYKIHEAEYLFRQSDTHTIVMEKGSRDSHYDEIMSELCPELDTKQPDEPLHAKRLPFLRNIITVGYEQKGCLTWEAAMKRAPMVSKEKIYRIASQVSPNDVCNMQYTSGTTGFPKGVMLTHYNIVNNGKCIGDRMDLSTADRMMIQVPMFHCFGMVLAMTSSMTHGSTLLPLPYFSAKAALSCVNNEHITAFHGVPTMFISMLEHADFPKTDFSYMRTGIMAGSPCPIKIMQEVVDKMHMSEIVIVYGQTEASPGCTMSSTDDPIEVRVTTVGSAMPEIECKIVDPETGEDLPCNVTGEFVARGYNIMKGYYKMPKETAAAIDEDGWLHTGDLACKTPEGNYKITGRLKDMIIRGGENIYPKEIEEFIYTHPKVSDVQVIGVPDEQYGEEIMACIILKKGETMTEDEIKEYVLTHMAKHKVPRYIRFVDSFPMNVAGKILKYKMREEAIELLGLQKANSTETA
ncbi:MAG: AMP-binding protein, partial [Clostridia bacterium]|nr:AMP-binding protein [Clostridia bacterium]